MTGAITAGLQPPRRAALVACLALFGAGGAWANAAQALPPLRSVAQIDDGLMAVALADEIRKTCDDIAPRMVRAYFYLNSLEQKAQNLGYSRDEIKRHVKSPEEKARMRKKAQNYVRAQGLNPANTADLCILGRQEIAKGSQIGALLRVK